MDILKKLGITKVETNNQADKVKAKQELSINMQSLDSLPRIDIKNSLNAIQNEELNELIPLYHIFLLKDSHLASEIFSRRSQLLTLPYFITSEDERVKEFLNSYLTSFSFGQLVFDISLAIPYGFSCMDMVYDNIKSDVGDIFVPVKFKAIHPRFFDYEKSKRLLRIKTDSSSKVDPTADSYKFLMHYHPTESGEIVDYALMQKVLFTALLKHTTINFNMQYFENFSIPPVLISLDTDDPEVLQSIFNQVKSLRSNSAALFPKDAEIKLLDSGGSKSDFLSTIQYYDNLISKLVNGNILSSNTSGSTGSFAMSQTHDSRRRDILTYDARLIEESINKTLKIIVNMNIPNAKSFQFKFDTNDEKDEQSLAITYKTLKEAGYQIPVEHIEKIFNISGIKLIETATYPSADSEENKQMIKEANSSITAKQLPTDELIDTFTDNLKLEDEDKEVNAVIESILSSTNSYQEAVDRLYELYPKTDFKVTLNNLENYLKNSSILAAGEYHDENKS